MTDTIETIKQEITNILDNDVGVFGIEDECDVESWCEHFDLDSIKKQVKRLEMITKSDDVSDIIDDLMTDMCESVIEELEEE